MGLAFKTLQCSSDYAIVIQGVIIRVAGDERAITTTNNSNESARRYIREWMRDDVDVAE